MGRLAVFSPPLFGEDLARASASPGLAIPADLSGFLSLCGEVSAPDVHNGYSLGGLACLTFAPPQGLNVPARRLGADGGGNVFLLPPHGVAKWLHGTGALEIVATSFTEFLERVALDWECFVAGASDHEYLSG